MPLRESQRPRGGHLAGAWPAGSVLSQRTQTAPPSPHHCMQVGDLCSVASTASAVAEQGLMHTPARLPPLGWVRAGQRLGLNGEGHLLLAGLWAALRPWSSPSSTHATRAPCLAPSWLAASLALGPGDHAR